MRGWMRIGRRDAASIWTLYASGYCRRLTSSHGSRFMSFTEKKGPQGWTGTGTLSRCESHRSRQLRHPASSILLSHGHCILAIAAGLAVVAQNGGVSNESRGRDTLCEASLEASPEQQSRDAGVNQGDLPYDFVVALRDIVGPEYVSQDSEERALHGKPWSSYHKITQIPDVIVQPASTEQVSRIMRLCWLYRIPVVPYGGATSLEGHTLAPSRGLSLDMNRMNRILRVSIEDLDATVEAGLGYLDLNEALRDQGAHFPLDPGPGASIGGMCACRCSGSTAVKYGTMRDSVLSVTAVLADGTVLKTGSRARKSAAGYDLTRLLIGSEGTLGIVTEVTLRLRRKPKRSAAIRVCFPSVREAAAAASATLQAGVEVGRCELMDDHMVRIMNEMNGLRDTEATTLLYEVVGISDVDVEGQMSLVEHVARKHGGYGILHSKDEADAVDMWRARKEALWAAQAAYPDREVMITDVCVPLSTLPDLIGQSKDKIRASSLPSPLVAHAGDGNFHAFIIFRPDRPEEVEEAKGLSAFMVKSALALDGTCTGEHGIGVGKIKYLEKEFGTGALQTMAAIKRALDPYNLLNPGKVLPQSLVPAQEYFR